MGLAQASTTGSARAGAGAPDVGTGLVSLLAHDMRVPLGPLALATSSLAADTTLPGLAREYAQIAYAQGEKVGRLLSAALIASGRLPTLRPARIPIGRLVAGTVDAFRALGGRIDVTEGRTDSAVVADAHVLGECFLNLAELAAGPAYRTSVAVELDGPHIVVAFACDDVARCADALTKDVPDDADAAFAMAAITVARELGAQIELIDTEITLALTPAEAG